MSIPGKVTEQIILEVITKHVEVKKLIWSNQHGIMKGRSCLISLRIGHPIYDGVSRWDNAERAVDAVYLNFSKAFGTVSQNILVGKLRKSGNVG